MPLFDPVRKTGLDIDIFFRHPLSGRSTACGPDVPNGWQPTGCATWPAGQVGRRLLAAGPGGPAAKGSTFGTSGEAPVSRGRRISGVDRPDIGPGSLRVKEKPHIIGNILLTVRADRAGRRPHRSAAGRRRRLDTRTVRSIDSAFGRPPGPRHVAAETGDPRSRCGGPAGGARSSAGEHCLHTAGVTGSNPVAPTIRQTYRSSLSAMRDQQFRPPQSPPPQSARCVLSRRSWRSWASMLSVAIGRASSRSTPIGSAVSSQKP